MALRNTELIKAYVDLDPRVAPLVLVIKHWTRRRSLNDGMHQHRCRVHSKALAQQYHVY